MSPDPKPDPEDVQAVYDRVAVAFDHQRRDSGMESGWVARFADALPARAEVLDLGCGSGQPVARLLLEHGCRVTGADFAPGMLALARASLPQADWVQADMRHLDLGRTFDGIIAWHSFFHLTVAAQRVALPKVLAYLRPGGVLMMTLGLEEGEGHGHVDGQVVYHASLSDAEYRAILSRHGVEVDAFVHGDDRCGGANVLFARRPL
ncbi:class I SAM-dependent methyltransferase [Pseudooceanicola onchidii]|uniref:class I SAM-dependent methyltransferase n=1 Tax=Pseudooceanicola onchidii TaxID=2562279 RepID=UPI0010AA1F6C|nr:class I SAM-dependent methyltransferase [Pseudooceanicola onchidii]